MSARSRVAPSSPEAEAEAVLLQPSAGVQARVRARLYALLDVLKHAGLSLDPIERMVDYWRDFGLWRAAAIVVLVVAPIVKFVWLPWMGSRVATTMAEMYGLDVEVGDWSGSWFDLRATAHDVVLKSRGRHTRAELAKADQTTIDLSFWRWVGGYGWVKSVVVDEPTVYLERSLAGRWNWEDLAGVSLGSKALHIATLRFDGMRIEWIEHLPGDSGGGLVHSSRAMLYVDDANVLLQDVVMPFDEGQDKTRFSINGRTADGVLSLEGSANFFHFAQAGPAAAPPAFRPASLTTAAPAWSPTIRANVYLENVGVAAMGQMLARGALLPAGGSMTGKIELALHEQKLTCRTDLLLKQVAYTANPASPLLRGSVEAMRTGLSDYRVNRRVEVGCEDSSGPGPARENFRPLNALQAAVTRAAVVDAPPAVQKAAAIDQRQVTGEITEKEVKAMSERFAQDAVASLAGRFGGEVGTSMVRQLTNRNGSAESGSAVSRGVKGIGRGFKKLFSRDKN